MTKKQVDILSASYFSAVQKWGESNLITQRAFVKYYEAKNQLEKERLKKRVNKLIENPRKWWKTPNSAFNNELPEVILEKDHKRIERMVYALESGEPL